MKWCLPNALYRKQHLKKANYNLALASDVWQFICFLNTEMKIV